VLEGTETHLLRFEYNIDLCRWDLNAEARTQKFCRDLWYTLQCAWSPVCSWYLGKREADQNLGCVYLVMPPSK